MKEALEQYRLLLNILSVILIFDVKDHFASNRGNISSYNEIGFKNPKKKQMEFKTFVYEFPSKMMDCERNA